MSSTMSHIFKIASLVFCFLVDRLASGILNHINKITSKQQRCPDVAYICTSKETT